MTQLEFLLMLLLVVTVFAGVALYKNANKAGKIKELEDLVQKNAEQYSQNIAEAEEANKDHISEKEVLIKIMENFLKVKKVDFDFDLVREDMIQLTEELNLSDKDMQEAVVALMKINSKTNISSDDYLSIVNKDTLNNADMIIKIGEICRAKVTTKSKTKEKTDSKETNN